MRCPLCGADGARPFLRTVELRVLRCPCGLAFAAQDTPPVPYEEEYFGRWGPEADAVVRMKKRTFRNVLDQIAFPGARRLLDIGCALGWSLDAAREAGYETAGVEVSEHAARSARARHDVRAGTPEFPDAAFDLVTLLDVIEHVRDPLGLLREACRVLRPGGRIALTTPDLSSLSARLMGPRWPYVLPEHVVYFDRGTIRRALRQAGLSPVRVGPLRKSLRAEYVASVLAKRGDAVGRLGSRMLRTLGGAEIGMMSGDLCALASRPA